MASQLVPFNPSANANFQFQATLDGVLYQIICTFNPYGQRYYFSIYDLTGNLILSRPIIGSPPWYNINLTAGYFDTSIVFRSSNQTFEIPGITPTVTGP